MKKRLVIVGILILCLWMFSGCAAAGGDIPAMENVPQELPVVVEDVVETASVVSPLVGSIRMDMLDDCTVAVSLGEDDAWLDEDGTLHLNVTVYAYDVYDMVDMSLLQPGDTIRILDENVEVKSVEHGDGTILINGGLDVGGYEFVTDENTVYYERGYSDAKSYYEMGTAQLTAAEDFLFTDASDLDNEPVTYTAAEFLDAAAAARYHFVPHNTKIVIEGGLVTQMERVYMP